MPLTKHTSRSISLKEIELYTIKIEYINGPTNGANQSIMKLLWSIDNGPEQKITKGYLYSK
ncbi:hypothetical protein ABE15_03170 [Bacillus cereus]|nr:hypothetical protein [Bacillus cereus]